MLNHSYNLFDLTVTIELSNTRQNNVDKNKVECARLYLFTCKDTI